MYIFGYMDLHYILCLYNKSENGHNMYICVIILNAPCVHVQMSGVCVHVSIHINI